MHARSAFVITSLFFAMFSTLTGFTVNAVTRQEQTALYAPKIEAMAKERQELLQQISTINDQRVRDLTITAYSPTVAECGPNPTVTASMTKVRPGIVAVSHDLFAQGWVFGKKVYVQDHGIFEIADLMAKRHTQRMDIFFQNTDEARRFGIKQTTVALLSTG